MSIDKKINLKNLTLAIFILFHLLFFISILLVDGYPQNNDILHIFKITSLDGKLKFINGVYHPGYAYYSLIFSNSLKILTTVIFFLIIFSIFLIFKFINLFSLNESKNERLFLYIFSILFHFIIISTIGLNHSDCLFLLLFYNGFLLFIYSYYFKYNKFLYITGLLIIGISILFRHHGILAIFLLYINFIFLEIFFYKKKFSLIYKNFILIGLVLLIPMIISQIHLVLINANTEWQTSLKLNYFVYGHTWGDWRDIKNILNSEQYKNFNILHVDRNHLLNIVLDHAKRALTVTYPFIISFIIAFIISRKKSVIILLILFILYLLIILPGYVRGYYPAILFCLISTLICYKDFAKNKIASCLIFIFLFGHLVYLIERYTEKVIQNYYSNKDIKENVVPILKSKSFKYKNIFSDDYNFYTNKLEGDPHKLCNWGGWLLVHPYFKDYYPRDVILGKKNDYCDVKALVTKDKTLADKYYVGQHYKFRYKTKKHYILTSR